MKFLFALNFLSIGYISEEELCLRALLPFGM